MNFAVATCLTLVGSVSARAHGEEVEMLALSGKKIVVIGGSRGLGRHIVETCVSKGGHVLAVARQEGPLRQLEQQVSGVEVLSLDATDDAAPAKVFRTHRPDVLILSGGASPPSAPLHEQSWAEFAVNWEVDVKIAFQFCKATLTWPLAAGGSVILIASCAGLGVSPNSGGYAGAKRTQILIANYSQKESDRLGLGLTFTVLAPHIMPDTPFGKRLIAGYSRYIGLSEGDFIASLASPPSAFDVAAAAIQVANNPDKSFGRVFIVSGRGLKRVS